MVKDFFSHTKDKAISAIRQIKNKEYSQRMHMTILMVLMLAPIVSTAVYAVGARTAANCAADYFRYCSQHPIGSDAVGRCFKANGEKLTKACVNALMADGEISKAEVAKIAREKGIASTKIEEVKEAKPNQTIKATDVVERVKDKTRNIVDRVKSAKKTIVKAVESEIKVVKNAVKKATTPNKKVAAKNKKEATKRKRKLQQGGKWDGYPLVLEWNDGGQREYGGELTPYGYRDRH
jgi:adenylate kinase